MNIAKYYASVGFQVDTRDIQKVDRALKLVEGKLRSLQKRLATTLTFDVSKFDVNQRRLNRVLGDALDIASTRSVFQVSRFNIDQGSLNRSLTRAMAEASRVASASTTLRPNTHASVARAAATGAAFGGIGLGRLGYAGLALAGGGYGLGALNRRNQEVVSAQLQAQAVVQQAGGTAEQGQASFQYLRSEANRIGFNYLDASADYNKLISGLTGSGFGVGESQKVFSGFAELARVNKLDRTTQNRLFRALSQVAGKDQLMAEELTGQIAEALPGGVSLFAQAYKRQTGKDLGLGDTSANSSEDIKKLLAAMKNREVRGEILIAAGQIASERANKGGALDLASQASQAEQARYQNTVSDLAVVASSAGVEEGFARIFRTLNAGLSESNGLVELLANGFNEATKWADDLILFPQSFIRALEGRDSLVADWLGADATKQLQQDWAIIKSSLESISTIGAPAWLPTLESTSKDIAAQFKIIAQIASGDFTGLSESLKNFAIDRYSNLGDALASGPNLALRAAGNYLGVSVPQISTEGIDYFAPRSIEDRYGLGRNPSDGDETKFNLFSENKIGFKDSNSFGEDFAKLDYSLPNINEDQKSYIGFDPRSATFEVPFNLDSEIFRPYSPPEDLSRFRPQSPEEIEDFNNQQRLAALETATITNQNTTNNEITIELNVDAFTLSQLDITTQAEQLTQVIAIKLEQVLGQFPQKE